MSFYPELFLLFIPWLMFVLLGVIASKLMSSARSRTGLAVLFGAFVQMFTPDPYVERTIETMVVEKKKQGAQKQGDPEDKNATNGD